ncbi:MAG: septum site-determining protein MinC [Lachnospiraceae bacterium]|nr:septum site-determining protein MinC [Lachnospiraceae bacterium]
MREAVIIKSFPNGIALYLNAEMPFENLLEEIGYKFSDARNFFGNVTMALSIDGRAVTDMEEIRILDTIRDNSDINVACIVEKDDTVNQNFVRALERTTEAMEQKPEGQFFRGDLKDREVLETENSIIMLGDIYPGSSIISAKNIIILGGLYGKAHAGGNGREGAFIAAFEMEPERIRIGDFKYKPGTRTPRWGIKPKVRPKIAYVKNDRVIVEALTKDLLSSF